MTDEDYEEDEPYYDDVEMDNENDYQDINLLLLPHKIKELLCQFHYFEEKIQYNSDSFFYLLTKNQEIYKNCGKNIKEINDKIRELCNKKSKEYDSLVIKENQNGIY